MNRTSIVTRAAAACVVFRLLVPGLAQEPPAPPQPVRPPDAVTELIVSMRAAEQAAKSFRIELTTEGRLPGDLAVRTAGTLRVLRGEQPAVHMRVQFEAGDGLESRIESVQGAGGIWILEDNPAFGRVFVHIEPRIVEDLAWAGELLQRDDLPGMADERAGAPLGSTMLDGLRRRFELAPTERTQRGEDAGVWLAGRRRVAEGAGDGLDLPLADRVEAFVRDADKALLEVVHWQGDQAVQRIVAIVEVDVPLDPASFTVDAQGAKVREVQQYLPLWEEIEQVLKQAEARAPKDVKRPSRRG